MDNYIILIVLWFFIGVFGLIGCALDHFCGG